MVCLTVVSPIVVGVQRGIIDVEQEYENQPQVIKSINSFILIEDSDDEDVNIIGWYRAATILGRFEYPVLL
jgi:hypothetical protein